MNQPIGVLDRIVDEIEHPRALERAKQSRKSLVQTVTEIETARQKAG